MDKKKRKERSLAILPENFGGHRVRHLRHDGEWWFAVEDVSGTLMDHSDGAASWRQLRQSLEAEGCEVKTLCRALELPTLDGRIRLTDCVTFEGIFRIVQSVSSPGTEALKCWLAQAGREEVKPQGYRTDTASIFSLLEDAVTEAIGSRQEGLESNDGAAAVRRTISGSLSKGSDARKLLKMRHN